MQEAGGKRPLISVIVPVYNEAESLPVFSEQLFFVWKELEKTYDYEVIFVNDGSQDGSSQIIESLSEANPRVKYIEFSRNFNKERALTAGLSCARGAAALMLDADLQHPVELIPEFLRRWRDGHEVVIGIRQDSASMPWLRRLASVCFYHTMNAIGETKLVEHSTDFRLLDRLVIDAFNQLTERNRLTRGLIDWLGFRRAFVPFNAPPRHSGPPRYNLRKLTRLAVAALVANSLFPLKIAGILGGLIILLAGGLGLFMFIETFLLADPWQLDFSGTAFLAVMILFLVGIILVCLGFIALYVGSIHAEVLHRPIYVIRSSRL